MFSLKAFGMFRYLLRRHIPEMLELQSIYADYVIDPYSRSRDFA